jgi:HAE1 family hydrophobic/amphiphilic exporter-1
MSPSTATRRRHAVNANQIENALYDAYGPRWVSTIYGSVNEYKVLLELEPRYQADPRRSPCSTSRTTGKLIPLDTLASFRRDRAADHQPLRAVPAATISFNLKPGARSASVVDRSRNRGTALPSPSARSSRARPKPSRVRWAICGCC